MSFILTSVTSVVHFWFGAVAMKSLSITLGAIVHHKKFGEGRVLKIINNEKFIHVKFTIGEKKFVYPDALMMGFLEVK